MRRGAGLAALAAILLAVGAWEFLLHRNAYAFLDRFHPRRVDVDLQRILPQGWRIDRPAGGARLTLLVFRYKDGPSVLAAMKRELTPMHGFRARNLVPARGRAQPPYDKDVTWQFTRGLGGSDEGDGARFSSGYGAADAEQLYEGTGRIGGSTKPACIVLISPAEPR